MPISSLTLLVEPDKLNEVQTTLQEKFGVDVYPPEENYLVVILETSTDQEMKSLFEQISSEYGVVSANIAYYNNEREDQ